MSKFYTYTEPADLTVGQALEAFAEGRLQGGSRGNFDDPDGEVPIKWWTITGWTDPEAGEYYEDHMIRGFQERGEDLDRPLSDSNLPTGYYAVRVAPEGLEEHRTRLWCIHSGRHSSYESNLYGYTDTPLYIEADSSAEAIEIYNRLDHRVIGIEEPRLGGKVYREKAKNWNLTRPATSQGEWIDVTEEDIDRYGYWYDDGVRPEAPL